MFSCCLFCHFLGGKNGRESLALIPGGRLNTGVDTERGTYVCAEPQITSDVLVWLSSELWEEKMKAGNLFHHFSVTEKLYIIQVWGITDPFLWCLQIPYFRHMINSILLFILCFHPPFVRSCARIFLTRLITDVETSSQPDWRWFSM